MHSTVSRQRRDGGDGCASITNLDGSWFVGAVGEVRSARNFVAGPTYGPMVEEFGPNVRSHG